MRARSIGTLQLRLQVNSEAATSGLVPAAQRFARTILDRALVQLDRKVAPRVVVIRTLPLSWRVQAAGLRRQERWQPFVDAIVSALEPVVRSARAPQPDDGLVVFDDDVHRVADCIWTKAAGRALPWFHTLASLTGPDALDVLCQAPAHRVYEVLRRLDADDRLATVLDAQDDATLDLVAARLEHDSTVPASVPGQRQRISDTGGSDPVGARRHGVARIIKMIGGTPDVEIPPRSPAAITERRAEAPGSTDDTSGKANADPTSEHRPETRPVSASIDAAQPMSTSRFGGVLWLANALLELELGPALWQACLPEAAALHVAFASLLQRPEDAVLTTLCGPSAADAPRLDIATSQRRRVFEGLAPHLRAFERRGLARRPVLHAHVVRTSAGRLLVVGPRTSAFALYAAPADDADTLIGELERVHAWAPGTTFSPALARLCRGTPAPEAEASPPWIPGGEDANATALQMMLVGWPCLLLAARTDAPPHDARAFRERWLAHPVRVVTRGDTTLATFPADAVDLAVRRCGFDRDPGLLPWSGQTLRFTFEGDWW